MKKAKLLTRLLMKFRTLQDITVTGKTLTHVTATYTYLKSLKIQVKIAAVSYEDKKSWKDQ